MTKELDVLLTPDALEGRWYLTVGEIAAATTLSRWTITRAIYEGELRATKLRRRWLVSADDARTWIQEQGETNVA